MSDAAATCIGGIYRFLDDETGETIEVPVSVDLAAAIAALDGGLARREKLRRRRERPAAAAAGRAGGGPDPVDPRTVAPARDGPRLGFTLLVGLGVRWDGPPPGRGPCPCCRGSALPAHAYCLGCDRSGRDDLLKPPSSPAATKARKSRPRPAV